MESFDQLVDLAHEASDRFREFTKIDHDATTMEQASVNYQKSKEICGAIQKRLDDVKMSEIGNGSSYGYDRCVYYMAKDVLNMYEYGALMILMSKMKRKLDELNKQFVIKKKKRVRNRKKVESNRLRK